MLRLPVEQPVYQQALSVPSRTRWWGRNEGRLGGGGEGGDHGEGGCSAGCWRWEPVCRAVDSALRIKFAEAGRRTRSEMPPLAARVTRVVGTVNGGSKHIKEIAGRVRRTNAR